MGRRWGSPTHLVYDAEDQQMHEVRAIQRRPAAERWSLEALRAVTAVPHSLRGPATAGDAEPLEVIPPAEGPDEIEPPAPTGRAPNRLFIEDADLRTYGYTANSPGVCECVPDSNAGVSSIVRRAAIASITICGRPATRA